MKNGSKFKESRLLFIGLNLFIVLSGALYLCTKIWQDFDQAPTLLRIILISLFLLAIIVCSIGVIATLTPQNTTLNFRGKLIYFFRGLWQHAKLPLLIVVIVAIFFCVWAFLFNTA